MEWVGWGESAGKNVTYFDMIDCREYMDDGLYADVLNTQGQRDFI